MHVVFFLGTYICIYMYMYACFQERVCRGWRRWIPTGFIRDGVYYFVAYLSKRSYGQWAYQPCQLLSSEASSLPAFANEFEQSKGAYWSCNVSSRGMRSVHELVFLYCTHEAIWGLVGIRCCVTSSAWDTDHSEQLARRNNHVRMSAIRFCVVRITDRTVNGQCDHELASLVYIVACLTCMCDFISVHISSKVYFLQSWSVPFNCSVTMSRGFSVVVLSNS